MPTARALEPGDPEEIGGYTLVGRLGSGEVYLARGPAGEQAVVKVIGTGVALPPLQINGVVPVLGGGLTPDGRTYQVLPYVSGPSLEELVDSSGPLDRSALAGLLVQTAATLASIHRMGLVYGGLAPSRVLSDDGEWLLEAPSGQASPDPRYSAPELVTQVDAGSAADVFAWGALAVFAATGRPAFPGSTIPAILYRVVQGEPDLEGLPDFLLPAVRAALSPDPLERPGASELALLLTGGPPPVGPPDPSSQPGYWGPVPGLHTAPPITVPRKPPSLVGPMVLLLVVLALVLAALSLDGSVWPIAAVVLAGAAIGSVLVLRPRPASVALPASSPRERAPTSRADLAVALHDMGRDEEAAAELRRVLADTPPGAVSRAIRTNLSVVLHSLGRTDEAVAELREVIDAGSEAETLVARTNLAVLMLDLGSPEAARGELETALSAARHALGVDHPRTLTIRVDLAAALSELGRADEAVAELRAVIAARTRLLGSSHPLTLRARNNLGSVLLLAGRRHAAAEVFEEVLRDGADDPSGRETAADGLARARG